MRSHPRLQILIPAALALVPATAFGHAGVAHGGGIAAGFGHPLAGWDHLLAMLAVGLWAGQMGGRSAYLVPGAFVAVMLAGAGLAMAGLGLPLVEAGIALSVVALGAAVAAGLRLPAALGMALVGVFALFHGQAHGAEMVAGTGVIGYCLGFAAATAMLHGGGLAIAWLMQRARAAAAVRVGGAAVALAGVYLAAA